ncbi:MAG: hypothetical protein M3247_08985 [Thermoproteota archaeon]|nr:hypothetical protein [Thermoproteota archaeon]
MDTRILMQMLEEAKKERLRSSSLDIIIVVCARVVVCMCVKRNSGANELKPH